MIRAIERRSAADPKLLRLGAVAVLGHSPGSHLRWLETVTDEVEVVAGQQIVAAGELLRAVVLPSTPDAIVRWGASRRPVAVGYVVGAVAVASRRPQPTTVIAAEQLRLWLIPVAQFQLVRERFPTIELALIDEARKLMT